MFEFRPKDTGNTEQIHGFRVYDEALMQLFTVQFTPKLDDPNTVITVVPVIGPIQREFSIQEKLNPEENKQNNIKDDKTVKLPAMALSRLNWNLDLTRWSRADYRRLKWSENGKAVHWSPHPMPFDIVYQLDIWTKFRSTMNQLVRKIIIKFPYREVWLSINMGGEFGIRRVPVRMDFGGPQELTSYELNEMDDRTIRNVMSFVLKGWVIPDGNLRPTVQKIFIDLNSNGNIPQSLVVTEDIPTLPTELLPDNTVTIRST